MIAAFGMLVMALFHRAGSVVRAAHVPVVARGFRRTAVPLASYYAVTPGLPLANGAAQSGAAFVEHALVVLVVPPIVILLACTSTQRFAALRAYCGRCFCRARR